MNNGVFKITEHATAKYYKVVAGNDVQFIKVSNYDNYTKQEIEDRWAEAKVPSYVTDIDDCFNNPLRLFQLVIFDSWVELHPLNMSVWEYESIVKGSTNVNPALKMAFISQDKESGTFSINCESYDYESHVNSENMKEVYKWRNNGGIEELEKFLNLKHVTGDVLY